MKRAMAVVFLSAALASLVGCHHSDKKKDKPAAIKSAPVDKVPDNVATKTETVPETPAKPPAAKPSGIVRLAKEFAPVDVDFGVALGQLVREANLGYNILLPDTEKNYPAEDEPDARGKKTMAFVLFKTVLGTTPVGYDEIVSEMDRCGCRPATAPRELLVFAASFPEEQKQCPIIALGGVQKNGQKQRLMLDYVHSSHDAHGRTGSDMVCALAFYYVSVNPDGKEIFPRRVIHRGFLAVKK